MTNEVMIDWVTAQVEATRDGWGSAYKPKIFDTGKFQKIAPTGEISDQFSSRVQNVGSFDNSLSFRAPYPHVLELSGNPAKFLQGHNLFGSSNKMGLFLEAGLASSNFSGVGSKNLTNRFPDPSMWSEFEFLVPKFTRVDLTRSYRFASTLEAREWIRSCAGTARSKHKAGLTRQGTVYFGQSSTRWSFKIYSKSDEINSKVKGHALSDKLSDSERKALLAWSEGVVRFELTLRSPELKKLSLDFDPLAVWEFYFSRISFNRNERLYRMDDLDALVGQDGKPMAGNLKMAVIAWRAGNDLRRIYSKNQYYRNLKALREWGFDVSVPVFKTEASYFEPTLDPALWNPPVIEELFHEPDPELPIAFGL